MTAMTCKLNGLFSIGEDFDDEDLLGTDWAGPAASGPAKVAAAVSSCALRASSAAHTEQEENSLQQTGESSAALCNGTGSGNSMQTAVGQTVALGLRQPASTQPHSLRPPVLNNAQTNLASQQSCFDTEGLQKACVAQDDFDDWDVDLADLDECDPQMGVGGHLPQPVQPPAPFPVAPTTETGLLSKKLRPPACGGTQTLPGRGLRELSTPCHTPGLSARNVPPPTSTSLPAPSPAPRPVCFSAPAQSPGVFPGLTATSHISSPFPRPVRESQQPQRPCTTPAPSPQGRSLFGSISPASSSVTCPGLSPRPIHTPVLTNHLVQLVSASSKLPRKRPRPAPQQPRTRRFPGPAGLLPQQPQGQSLDDIVVSVPQTPAHGAVARLPNQPPSSQTEEDEFSGGPWAVMKAEMGLDERNPSCFLHSYSVVMVLRKAALKQLAKNKVPNMAVLLKSIVHTYTDAKAVFKDPTGEIQGTVHRRLLEDRLGELKPGAVLLLKQVGVFSPSHRNHYLNVTPNNLLRIYPPDGVSLSSTQLPPLALESVLHSPAQPPSSPVGPVSRMQLVFDEDEEEEQEEGQCREAGQTAQVPVDSRAGSSGTPAPQDQGWDADDDLDELLGELPEETYCL